MSLQSTHRANTDYTVLDRNPLQLTVGEQVRLGPEDKAWPGWVWAIAADGRGSHVPKDHLRLLDDHRAEVVRPFSARDLSVKRGDRVSALREVKGWLWCRNEAGEEGWLPEFVLSPLKPQ